MATKSAKRMYSASKARKVQKAVALNSEKIPVGKKLIFVSIEEGTPNGDRPNDSVRFTVDGKLRNIPMSQYLQFAVKDGTSIMNDEGEEEIEIYSEITIESATDRKNAEGASVWPLSLYKETSAMFADGGTFDYQKLVEGGFKDGIQEKIDANKVDPVQDYTVSVA